MREILFRGESCYDHTLVYGSLTVNKNNSCAITHGASEYGYIAYGIQVFPETIGQFTGITDENGKRIFEGDILCAMTGWSWNGKTRERYLEYVKVIYNSQKTRFEIFGKLGESHKAIDQAVNKYNATVVGNIYDNPDLMKEIIK